MMSIRWWTMTILVFPLIAALSAPAVTAGDELDRSTIIFGVS